MVVTGDELVAPGEPLAHGQIHESNSILIAARCRQAGAEVVRVVRVPDDAEATSAALALALREADVVVTSGGVSVGTRDHVKPALASLGVEQLFWRMAVQPGRPTWCGMRDGRVVVGLPGNPLSVMVGLELLLLPALLRLAGAAEAGPATFQLPLTSALRRDPERLRVRPVRLVPGGAEPLGADLSHQLARAALADALALVPVGEGELRRRAPPSTSSTCAEGGDEMAEGGGIRPAALGAIGGTPIVRLTRIVGPEAAEVWVKLEAANPTGSYKDRMALAMIEGAEQSGDLQPGQTVVEYTGGSTGSSLAFVCAIKGYPTRLVTSDAFAEEKLATMRAFGATLEVLPSPEGITPQLIPAMRERALAIAEDIGGFRTDQFENHDMLTGYRDLGAEILAQLDARVDAWVAYVGTAGCFLGVGAALRERLPAVRRVAVEPDESAVLSGRPAGTHRIEGGGTGSVPPLLDVARDVDEVRPRTARRRRSRWPAGQRAKRASGRVPSTGANLSAAIAVARELGPGHRVVTVAVDSGLKYLGGPLYRQG